MGILNTDFADGTDSFLFGLRRMKKKIVSCKKEVLIGFFPKTSQKCRKKYVDILCHLS